METALIGIAFLIILVLGHEFGHFFAAKYFGLRVDEFGFGFPPKIFARQKGETKYSFNLLPFGGFVRIHGEHAKEGEILEDAERSFSTQSALKRSLIILAGAFMNFLIGWVAFSVVFAFGIPNRVVIESVMPGSPAEAVGFRAGDTLSDFGSAEEFVTFINDNKGQEILINGTSIVPRENPPVNEGALGVVVTDVGIERQNIFMSLWSGLSGAAMTTLLIAQSFFAFLVGLFAGDSAVLDGVTGPVGIFGMLGDVSTLGVLPLVQFLGLISLNLVVINLIPFPALDGGRFFSILIEKVVGRRLNHKFEVALNAVGLVLLLLLMVVVTARDIMRIF